LMKAARRFDETRGFKFISYAVWWIRQSIMLAIVEQARLVRMPLNKVGSYTKLNRLSQQLEQEFEREPTIEELAAAMDMKEGDLKDLAARGNLRHISMDAPVSSDADNATMLDLMQDNDSGSKPDKDLLSDSLKEEISAVLKILSKRESEIITAYFGLNGTSNMSLEEIAENFELTRERVRQIKERAIRRLRKATSSKLLKGYL
jgi:RNA polymerase primary sigma factor